MTRIESLLHLRPLHPPCNHRTAVCALLLKLRFLRAAEDVFQFFLPTGCIHVGETNQVTVFKVTLNRQLSVGLCHQPDSSLLEFVCFILLFVVFSVLYVKHKCGFKVKI